MKAKEYLKKFSARGISGRIPLNDTWHMSLKDLCDYMETYANSQRGESRWTKESLVDVVRGCMRSSDFSPEKIADAILSISTQSGTKEKVAIIGNIPNGKILAKNILSQSGTKGAEGEDHEFGPVDLTDVEPDKLPNNKPLTGGIRSEEIIREILKGIDQDECESDDGWWPTSTGVEFGTKKLNELLDYLKSLHLPSEGEIKISSRGNVYVDQKASHGGKGSEDNLIKGEKG